MFLAEDKRAAYSEEKFYRAQITKRVDFAPDLWTFRVRAGGEFPFVPGQYASLGVEVDGKRVERNRRSSFSSNWSPQVRSRLCCTSCKSAISC
jgi:ferredoxin-NADP reductase